MLKYRKASFPKSVSTTSVAHCSQRIKSVYVTKPEAYGTMWKKSEDYYDDTSATVQAALEALHRLKAESESDYRGLVECVDVVKSSYN